MINLTVILLRIIVQNQQNQSIEERTKESRKCHKVKFKKIMMHLMTLVFRKDNYYFVAISESLEWSKSHQMVYTLQTMTQRERSRS